MWQRTNCLIQQLGACFYELIFSQCILLLRVARVKCISTTLHGFTNTFRRGMAGKRILLPQVRVHQQNEFGGGARCWLFFSRKTGHVAQLAIEPATWLMWYRTESVGLS